MKKLVESQPHYQLVKGKNLYLEICSSIISQQLSTKVAAVINGRFLGLFKKKIPTLQEILNVPHEQLRAVGLSNAKANYVKNVCRFFIENKLTDAKLYKMENEAFIEFITQIKGIGRWSAEMILMFTLGREDVFSLDDLGIQQAMTKLYNLDATDKKEMKLKMTIIAEKWSPYRTYACKYLWGWKDNTAKAKNTD